MRFVMDLADLLVSCKNLKDGSNVIPIIGGEGISRSREGSGSLDKKVSQYVKEASQK